MKEVTTLKDFYGKIIGYIQVDNNGNKIVRDFYRKILGRYDKTSNVTRDFYGRMAARGDQSSGLIYMRNRNEI